MRPAPMSVIFRNLEAIRNRMRAACSLAQRGTHEVDLVAVSKTFPADAIREAYDAGQRVFGESRLQEAMPKIETLPTTIEWHFIGRVQRNKLRKILSSFKVIHGIDSFELADAAERIAGELGIHPKVFLQVNLAGEQSKGGFEPSELARRVGHLLGYHHLDIQGLMAIPPPAKTEAEARQWFSKLRMLRDAIEAGHRIKLPNLSMGMSDDFEAAILEGSSHVRIGSAIFGNRSPSP